MARLSAQLTTTPLPMPRSVSVGVLVIDAVAIIVIAAVISANIRYRLELEPPGQYNHPYAGRVDERVMAVAEVRTLCQSVGASGRFVACAWVSKGIFAILYYRTMSQRRSLLTVGTKLPIAMVGRQAIPTTGDALITHDVD
jgi:hypothetical protein